MKNKLLITCSLLLLSNIACAQDNVPIKTLKDSISNLSKKNKIEDINKVLNHNTYLPPEYVLSNISDNLQRAKLSNSDKLLADTYLTLGNFWYTQGNPIKAYENYTLSETYSDKSTSLKLKGLSLLNRSNLVEKYSEKVRMLKEAVALFTKIKDTLNLAKAHLNLGNIYSISAQTEDLEKKSKNQLAITKAEALKEYELAKSLNVTIRNPEISASITVHLAEWEKFEGNYSAATKLFKEAENYFVQGGRIKGQVYCLNQLILMSIEKKDFKQALAYLSKAESISKKFEYKDYLAQIYQQYARVYATMGDYKQALNYNQLYASQAIELSALNSRDKIQIINLEQELTKKELIEEKYLAQKKINNIIKIVGIALLLLITTISYLLIQNKKRKVANVQKNQIISDLEKQTLEMELKNQKLEEELLKEKVQFSQDHLILVSNQINNIEAFTESLKLNLKKFFKQSENQKTINELKLSFSEILYKQKELKQLYSYNSQLNQDFFFYIQKEFQGVSEKDLQLLAYIILNMDVKEIGNILNISEESVYKKRYRLRKKLNLGKDESFLHFYKNIAKNL